MTYCIYKIKCIAGLLKIADVQTHVCAQFSRTCAKKCTFKWGIGKTGNKKKYIGTIWQNSLNLTCFYGILSQFLCAKILFRKSACAKKIMFRRSGVLRYFGFNKSMLLHHKKQKSRIREIKGLSTDADSRTNTILERLRDLSLFPSFFF